MHRAEPDKFVWNILKYQRQANFCPGTIEEMESAVRRELCGMKGQPEQLRSDIQCVKTFNCWRHPRQAHDTAMFVGSRRKVTFIA